MVNESLIVSQSREGYFHVEIFVTQVLSMVFRIHVGLVTYFIFNKRDYNKKTLYFHRNFPLSYNYLVKGKVKIVVSSGALAQASLQVY